MAGWRSPVNRQAPRCAQLAQCHATETVGDVGVVVTEDRDHEAADGGVAVLVDVVAQDGVYDTVFAGYRLRKALDVCADDSVR